MPGITEKLVVMPFPLDYDVRSYQVDNAQQRCLRHKQVLPYIITSGIDIHVSQRQDEALSRVAPLPYEVTAAPKSTDVRAMLVPDISKTINNLE